MEENRKKRIAVVDLLFSFPPAGGAGVDLLANFTRLQKHFDIKVFGLGFNKLPPTAPHDFRRGDIASPPPLDYTIVNIEQEPKREEITESILQTVSKWNPDLVFVADGWTLKPFVVEALCKRFKTVVRIYSYEMLCPRNNQRWLFNHQCNKNALENISDCKACVREYSNIVREKRGSNNPLTYEASIANLQTNNDYFNSLKRIVTCCSFIVYNSLTANILRKNNAQYVTIIPGGVDIKNFNYTPPTSSNQKTTHKHFDILVPGRMDDIAKGADVAVEAGKILAKRNLNFRMTITGTKKCDFAWLDEIGWRNHAEIASLMERADCVLIPSLWEEAFGMTWTEAMASGTPIIASNTGGPKEYIKNRDTGILVEPGDAKTLAEAIWEIYGDDALRVRLSKNGRKEVEKLFNWEVTSERHRALFDSIV